MPPESSSPTDVTRVLWTSTHYNWDYLLNANIPFKTLGSERAESFYNSVQFSSVAQLWLTLCNPRDSSMPGLPVHRQFLEFVQTHVHWVSDAIRPSHPLSSPSLPTFNLSQHQGLLNESVLCLRCPKYWSFSFSISPSNEYSGLISFRMDWLDLLAVQGTLKSLLQHHTSKASILQCSAFLIVPLSHPVLILS